MGQIKEIHNWILLILKFHVEYHLQCKIKLVQMIFLKQWFGLLYVGLYNVDYSQCLHLPTSVGLFKHKTLFNEKYSIWNFANYTCSFFCKLLLKGQGLVIYIITNFTQITKEIFLPPIVRNYKNRKYMNFEISITL